MNNREISEQIQEDIRTYMSGITGEEDKESLVDNLCEIISYRFMIESKQSHEVQGQVSFATRGTLYALADQGMGWYCQVS